MSLCDSSHNDGILAFTTMFPMPCFHRVIAYGILANCIDHYLHIGEDTKIEAIRMSAKVMIRVFGYLYLRSSNKKDTQRLMTMSEKRG
jgi:hypothetical protein